MASAGQRLHDSDNPVALTIRLEGSRYNTDLSRKNPHKRTVHLTTVNSVK